METVKVKYLIIGSGVSGLAFANHLDKSEYIIIEKEDEPGGFCRTVYEGDYVWDWAGHFFHFATKKWEEFFRKRIDEGELVSIKKNTKIYFKNRLIDYPFQKNIHQLEQQDFIDCLYDLFKREELKDIKSFKQMLYSKFGNSIADLFLIPYNEKLYACDLDRLDTDAMGRFFPYANLNEIIDNMKKSVNDSYNDYFLYPKKGAKIFVDALMQDISASNISLKEEVIFIDKNARFVRTNKREIIYEKLINTMPQKELIKICGDDLDDSIMSCNKVLVFNLGFDKKSKYNDIHWMYVPDKDINFYRIGFYDNILNQNKLSMYIEIGYKENDEIDIECQLEETLFNLKKIGIIDDHELKNYHYCIMKPAYVHISKNSKDYVSHKIKEYEQLDIYSIGRYGLWKYCSIEDCLIDADNLYERL